MSHRGAHFESILAQTERDLRDLLLIPNNYKVLFLQGGGLGLFAAIPLNLAARSPGQPADYLVTGAWSKTASQEGSKYCGVNIVASTESEKFRSVPAVESYAERLNPLAPYFYYCPNETVHGVEFSDVPVLPHPDVPIVADFSSSFLSHPIDVAKFGVIFAGAQKNVGPAGVTIVIVREDLLGFADPKCPSVWNFKSMADNSSMINTPPCFNIYMCGLVFQHLKQRGGLQVIAEQNARKAALLYSAIDQSNGFYQCPVASNCRSRMNVVYRIGAGNAALDKKFVSEGTARGLLQLAGHRSVGGLRASIYNAMSVEGVQALVDFMANFQNKYFYLAEL
eukprot:TRINITY_DN5410_c0_g1_i7.p1 TRINITY_DN5410_c0_g1~~TRINITY_DN5410_c0_g1_i7.p1  ORF type:complete len:357 (-),score=78.55 TRINITY_DN5410_c0_g1_i7:26-1036(-)